MNCELTVTCRKCSDGLNDGFKLARCTTISRIKKSLPHNFLRHTNELLNKHVLPLEFAGNKMAYLKKEKETVEIDYPIEKVWTTISKALTDLEWTIEQTDETTHQVKAKTKAGFISWSSALLIDVTRVDEKTTRVSVAAETPVTTITSIVDFGRTRQRIDLFFAALAKQLTP